MKNRKIAEYDIPEEYLDPITSQLMVNPVTTKNGQTYSKKSIQLWLNKHNTDPMSNETLYSKALTPNHELQNKIKKWKKTLTAKQRIQLFLDSYTNFNELPNKLNALFNPFDTVRYHGKELPNSRSLHTKFKNKVKDALAVIKGGSWVVGYKKTAINTEFISRPGLFDYATLGIFTGFQALSGLFLRAYFKVLNLPLEKEKNIAKKIGTIALWILMGLAGIPFVSPHLIGNGLIRPAISFTLTFILLPVIWAADRISHKIANYKEEKFTKATQIGDSTMTMHQVLGSTPLSNVFIEIDSTENSMKFSTDGITIHEVKNFDKEKKEKLMEVNYYSRQLLLTPDECKPRHRL